jgi:peptidoglycan hydrolase CwlO-like protein
MPKIEKRKRDLFDWIIVAGIVIGMVTGVVFWVTDTSKEESYSAALEVEQRLVEKIENVNVVAEIKNDDVNKKLSKLDSSINVLHKRIGETNTKISSVKEKVNNVNIRQAITEAEINSIGKRLNRLEELE